MKKKYWFFLGAVAFFLLFLYFTWFVKKDLFISLDFDLAVKIQDKIPRKFYDYLAFVSDIGHFEILGLVLLIILALRKKISGILIFTLFLIGHLGEIFLKTFLHQPPPPYLFYKHNSLISFANDYVNPGSSYPSGHSFRSIFLLVFLGYLVFRLKKQNLLTKTILIGIFAGVAFLIIFSKVALGEHWPTDLVGGILLGVSFGLLSLIFV